MFKKVKDLFKKKPSPPAEEKPKGEKPVQPGAGEVSASPEEAAGSSVSEKTQEQRSVSAAPEKGEPKKLKEPEKPKTPSLKPEESKEPKTVAFQDQPPAAEPPKKSAVASPKEKKAEMVKEDSAEEKKSADTTLQLKKTPVVTVDAVSAGPGSSGETSPSDSKKEQPSQTVSKPEEPKRETIKLQGLFAFKMSMTSLYDEQGRRVSVTALKYKPWVVSQIKTKEKEGYSAAQLACGPQKNNRSTRPLIKHLAPAGFKEGARYIREIRQDLPENVKVGQELSIESLKKGDRVRISSRSKGRGYAGVVKKWGFSGGPASHGSKTHRGTGSIGQGTEPSRVIPGRKMPGQYGFETITLNSVPVVDVLPAEGVIFVKGPVSGSRNTLVSLKKVEEARA